MYERPNGLKRLETLKMEAGVVNLPVTQITQVSSIEPEWPQFTSSDFVITYI